MTHTLHVIDAFTDVPFQGNPAAVCVVDHAEEEAWMQRVAREMNLSETAFVRPIDDGYHLRWFTPGAEVTLCGHATLASAFTLWTTGRLAPDAEARFHTLSGWLTCRREGNWIVMDFPAKPVTACEPPPGLADALGCTLGPVGLNGMDYLVEVADAAIVRGLSPNFTALSALPVRGVIVTSASDTPGVDFVSRFFAPAVGVNEDPVTGSAHCALGPYWSAKLGKGDLVGRQVSARGGTVKVGVRGDRILLSGQAVLVSLVTLFV
jgi:predicted PhzF superfamily epimerase YddE/YHI9